MIGIKFIKNEQIVNTANTGKYWIIKKIQKKTKIIKKYLVKIVQK